MNNRIILMVTILFTGLALWSCEKEELYLPDELENIDLPEQAVEFNLVLRNTKGEYTNTIKNGEDFYIGLQGINRMNDTLHYANWHTTYGRLHSDPNFLYIYRVAQNNSLIRIGRPFDFSASHFHGYISLTIPPGENSRGMMNIGHHWSSVEKNKSLPPGNYISYLDHTVQINDLRIMVIDSSKHVNVTHVPVKIKTVLRFTVE